MPVGNDFRRPYGRPGFGFGYGGFGRRPFGFGAGPFLGGFVGGLAAGALLRPPYGFGGYPGYYPYYPPYPPYFY